MASKAGEEEGDLAWIQLAGRCQLNCSKHWGFSVFSHRTSWGLHNLARASGCFGIDTNYNDWLRSMEKKTSSYSGQDPCRLKGKILPSSLYNPSKFKSALKLHRTFLRAMDTAGGEKSPAIAMPSACNEHHSGAPAWRITILPGSGRTWTFTHVPPISHFPCSFQGIPGNWQVMRRELPPGATVLQGQFCNFLNKREKGQAGSFTAVDEILGISPPVYFTARLHCSIPCSKQHRLVQGKENQTLGCWLGSDTPRALYVHSERDRLATGGINWVLGSSTGPPHGLAPSTSAFFAQCSGMAS